MLIKKLVAELRKKSAYYSNNHQRLHIYTVTPEAEVTREFPFTGGLGEVGGALPQALSALGHKVTLIIPSHTMSIKKLIKNNHEVVYFRDLEVNLRTPEGSIYKAEIYKSHLGPKKNGIEVYLIDSSKSEFFGKRNYRALYGGWDDVYRFYFFNLAASQIIKSLVTPRTVKRSIYFTHDWQAANLHTVFNTLEKKLPIAGAHVIHNLKYCETVSLDDFYKLSSLSDHDYHGVYSGYGLEHPAGSGRANPTAAAIRMASKVITVSQNYAQEVLGDLGEGYQPLLRKRFAQGDFHGITNGVGETWHPHYTPDEIVSAKNKYKCDVQAAYGLKKDPHKLLLMMAARYDSQKGFNIIAPLLHRLANEKKVPFQFVISADASSHEGDAIKQQLVDISQRYRDDDGSPLIGLKSYNQDLTHAAYAGADIALIPSMFEPCGLVAPISILHGTWPIGRHTGGIPNFIRHGENGFLVDGLWPYQGLSHQDMAMRSHYLVQQFAERINETYLMFQQKLSWYRHLKNLMKSDLSWQSVAPQYIDVFREGIERYQKDGPAQFYGG